MGGGFVAELPFLWRNLVFIKLYAENKLKDPDETQCLTFPQMNGVGIQRGYISTCGEDEKSLMSLYYFI